MLVFRPGPKDACLCLKKVMFNSFVAIKPIAIRFQVKLKFRNVGFEEYPEENVSEQVWELNQGKIGNHCTILETGA